MQLQNSAELDIKEQHVSHAVKSTMVLSHMFFFFSILSKKSQITCWDTIETFSNGKCVSKYW